MAKLIGDGPRQDTVEVQDDLGGNMVIPRSTAVNLGITPQDVRGNAPQQMDEEPLDPFEEFIASTLEGREGGEASLPPQGGFQNIAIPPEVQGGFPSPDLGGSVPPAPVAPTPTATSPGGIPVSTLTPEEASLRANLGTDVVDRPASIDTVAESGTTSSPSETFNVPGLGTFREGAPVVPPRAGAAAATLTQTERQELTMLSQADPKSLEDLAHAEEALIGTGDAVLSNRLRFQDERIGNQARLTEELFQDTQRFSEMTQRHSTERRERIGQLEDWNRRISAREIDPTRFYSSRGEGARVGATIAVALGGLARVLTGDSVNRASGIIEAAVDRDIQAQVANLANQRSGIRQGESLYGQLVAAGNDERTAAAMTRELMINDASQRILEIESRATRQDLIDRYSLVRAQLQQQSAAARVAQEQSHGAVTIEREVVRRGPTSAGFAPALQPLEREDPEQARRDDARRRRMAALSDIGRATLRRNATRGEPATNRGESPASSMAAARQDRPSFESMTQEQRENISSGSELWARPENNQAGDRDWQTIPYTVGNQRRVLRLEPMLDSDGNPVRNQAGQQLFRARNSVAEQLDVEDSARAVFPQAGVTVSASTIVSDRPGALEAARLNPDKTKEAGVAIDNIVSFIDSLNTMITAFAEHGGAPGNPFGEAAGEMQVLNVTNTMKFIQLHGLAPVSDTDIRTVAEIMGGTGLELAARVDLMGRSRGQLRAHMRDALNNAVSLAMTRGIALHSRSAVAREINRILGNR